MMLNATFFVQLLHIIVAYLLLDRFLLRQAIALVQEDDQKDKTLSAHIEREQALVREKEMAKAKAWHHMRRRFSESIPHLKVTKLLQMPAVASQSADLSEREKRDLTQEVVTFLKAKVDHVH